MCVTAKRAHLSEGVRLYSRHHYFFIGEFCTFLECGYITRCELERGKMKQFEQQKRQKLITLINELESLLRQKKRWESQRPSEQALSSHEPFAIDTLNFDQWLQFIFIEKMTYLLQLNLALPRAMAITPMATEYFKLQKDHCPEIVVLSARIDTTINEK